jgi:hypothetical protein
MYILHSLRNNLVGSILEASLVSPTQDDSLLFWLYHMCEAQTEKQAQCWLWKQRTIWYQMRLSGEDMLSSTSRSWSNFLQLPQELTGSFSRDFRERGQEGVLGKTELTAVMVCSRTVVWTRPWTFRWNMVRHCSVLSASELTCVSFSQEMIRVEHFLIRHQGMEGRIRALWHLVKRRQVQIRTVQAHQGILTWDPKDGTWATRILEMIAINVPAAWVSHVTQI